MTWRDHISIDSGVLVGKPVIRGTRIAVEFVVDLLAQGWSADDVVRNYPGISIEQIRACLLYASDILKAERVYSLPV